MYLTNDFDLMQKNDGSFYLNGTKLNCTTDELNALKTFYNFVRRISVNDRADYAKSDYINEHFSALANVFFGNDEETTTETETEPKVLTEEEKKVAVIAGISHLIDFFKEFDFEPNFRFINTLSINLKSSQKNAKEYIRSYFELIDSPYFNEINEKIKSKEFSSLLNELKTLAPTKKINHRFKLYYGSQGTGKTTIAMNESGSNPIVCNSSMLPSDIMEDFVFVDGKATYKPSAFWRAMVEGRQIVMDEINLLPYETLRFLQGILDNKSAITYKGNDIEISENFSIIGTMNLTVNGMTYGLPEPLVDRCAVAKKFTLTANDLISAIV